jgi:hypothetical protein
MASLINLKNTFNSLTAMHLFCDLSGLALKLQAKSKLEFF